jgi:hypothetical protein
VAVQILAGGLAVAVHNSLRVADVVTVDAPGSRPDDGFHNEWRCTLCHFAEQSAHPVPTDVVALDAVLTESSVIPYPAGHANLQVRFRPSSRAPPVTPS